MSNIPTFVKVAIGILLLVVVFLFFRGRDYTKEVLELDIDKDKAKIAIVLDDFGYNMSNIDMLFEIDVPLSISILPNLPYSRRIAERASERNIEVILHLPLEPHGDKTNLEENTIRTDMTPQQVNHCLSMAIKSVPELKGISNHMGSKATEDRALMHRILNELKIRNLYFLDNLVTDRSVCKEIAVEIGVPVAARSVFLDNEVDQEYIEAQVRLLAKLATDTGWAIGIGHDRHHTLRTLTKVIPELRNNGFEFVYVSDLVE